MIHSIGHLVAKPVHSQISVAIRFGMALARSPSPLYLALRVGTIMTFCEIYAELKGWQPVIGAVLGFGALTWGALYNFRLGRRRDDAIRAKEALSVALGLYAEINLISVELTKLSNAIGRWYLRTGHSGQSVPAHFSESFVLPEATLFKALAPKIGMLDPDVLMPIVRFYGHYGEAVAYFPKILEKTEDSAITYGVEWVLGPAIAAIDGVQSALREIEQLGEIAVPMAEPDLKKAREAQKLEEDMHPHCEGSP